MKLPEKSKLIRIFIGEDDRYENKPLYEAIVEMVRKEGLAGATVLKGVLGFGAKSRIHTSKILRLSEDMPMVIEIVDKPERIEKILPLIDKMIGEGLVTIEDIEVMIYRHSTLPHA